MKSPSEVVGWIVRTEPLGARVEQTISRVHRAVLRRTHGRVGGRFGSGQVVLLTSVGRRTGTERITPLTAVARDDGWAVIGTNGGRVAHPDWVFNLRADNRAAVTIRARTRAVDVREVHDQDEWHAILADFIRAHRTYASYVSKCERRPAVFVLTPATRESES